MTKEDIITILLNNRNILKEYTVKSVALFGSYARDEQREDSDVDLLVEFDEDTYSNFINLTYALEDLLKKDVTVVSEDDISPYIRPHVLEEAECIEG